MVARYSFLEHERDRITRVQVPIFVVTVDVTVDVDERHNSVVDVHDYVYGYVRREWAPSDS